MVDRTRALLAEHLPGYVVRSVQPLGQGLENVAVAVNGELVVRWRSDDDTAARAVAVAREAAVLSAVRAPPGLPVAVPEPVVVAPDAGALAYPLLPGCAALGRSDVDPAIIGPVLGAVLRTLDGADFAHLVEVDAEPLRTWLAAAAECFDEVADLIPGEVRPRVEAFLAAEPPPEPERLGFAHHDLGAEHLLLDGDGALVSIVDWADAAVADPAHDAVLILRDFGPDVLAVVLAHADRDPTTSSVARTAFHARCALLEDLSYGITSRDRRYVDAGLTHLARVFG